MMMSSSVLFCFSFSFTFRVTHWCPQSWSTRHRSLKKTSVWLSHYRGLLRLISLFLSLSDDLMSLYTAWLRLIRPPAVFFSSLYRIFSHICLATSATADCRLFVCALQKKTNIRAPICRVNVRTCSGCLSDLLMCSKTNFTRLQIS